MDVLLTILIPSTPDREDETTNLVNEIKRQCFGGAHEVKLVEDNMLLHYISFREFGKPVEIMIGIDDKKLTIGEKRELLYQHSIGKMSWQIDSDDMIAPNAVELILEAIKSNPEVDVISFEEYCNMDGKEYKSNHSGAYSDWEGDGNSLLSDGFHFHRTIFFKDVIRTKLAQSVPVPRLRWSEDHEWAKLLKPLIQSEVHISEQLYRYIHVSSNPQERYGLDK